MKEEQAVFGNNQPHFIKGSEVSLNSGIKRLRTVVTNSYPEGSVLRITKIHKQIKRHCLITYEHVLVSF